MLIGDWNGSGTSPAKGTANRVGQFKFFEVFIAAECRQIPRIEKKRLWPPGTGALTGVFGSGCLSRGDFYWPGGTAPWALASFDWTPRWPGLITRYVLIAEDEVLATFRFQKTLRQGRVPSTLIRQGATFCFNIAPCLGLPLVRFFNDTMARVLSCVCTGPRDE